MWTHLPLIFSRSLAYLSLILFLYLFVLPLCAAIVLTDCQLNSEFHLEALGLKLGFFFSRSQKFICLQGKLQISFQTVATCGPPGLVGFNINLVSQ